MATQPTGTHIWHGGYGLQSRFEIVQHHYAGGPGYVEVLEIKNPPPGKHPIVLCHYGSVWDKGEWKEDVYHFWEFRTVVSAELAMDIVTGNPYLGSERLQRIRKIDGLLRASRVSASRPWFYAKVEETVDPFGDFVA
jgi:hypothetical protein